jgi:hypothetical protein
LIIVCHSFWRESEASWTRQSSDTLNQKGRHHENLQRQSGLDQRNKKTADAFISEFDGIADEFGDARQDGADRTPKEMIAYQLGWMSLMRGWGADEAAGKPVAAPAPDVKWNQMAMLRRRFYDEHCGKTLSSLRSEFRGAVGDYTKGVK